MLIKWSGVKLIPILNFVYLKIFWFYIFVLSQVKEKMNKVKMTRKHWFPVNQAWFDQVCKVENRNDMGKGINPEFVSRVGVKTKTLQGLSCLQRVR